MQDKAYYVKGKRDLIDIKNFESIKPRIKAVAFDIDGTITDSIGQIVACTHYTFDTLNIPRVDDDIIKGMIGKKLQEGLISLLEPQYLHLSTKITDVYRQTFIDHDSLHETKIFPGIRELFEVLKSKNIKIAFASGKSTVGIKRNLNDSFLGEYCDSFCAGDEVPSKPDPSMIHTLAKRLAIKENEILGVGDAAMDIQMFHNAGSFSCGVQSGVWSGEALKSVNPDILVPHARDLIELFAK